MSEDLLAALTVADLPVTQLRFDPTFTFTVDARVDVTIETPFEFARPSGKLMLEPENTLALAPLLGLHGAVISNASATRDGILTVHFANGTSLVVQPHDSYEAWNVVGRRSDADDAEPFRIVCMPGGKLAVWS